MRGNLTENAISLGVILVISTVVAAILGSMATQSGNLPLTASHSVVNETITFTTNGTNYSFAQAAQHRPVTALTNPITNGTHNLYTTGNFTNNATHIFMNFAHLAGEPREGLAYNVSYSFQTTDYPASYNATQGGIAGILAFTGFGTTMATVIVGVAILVLLVGGFAVLGSRRSEPSDSGGL